MARMDYITSSLSDWKTIFGFNITIKVRFSETDMFGHMNNTVPFTYFEEARIEFFKSLGFMQEWTNTENETIPVVADLQCDYLKQVYFDEYIRIYVKAASIGRSSVDLHYMGVDANDEICFTGRNSLVNMSKKTGKSVEWNSEWKNKLEFKV